MRPSACLSNSTSETSVEDSLTYSRAESVTPMPTAAWMGSKSVERNVVTIAKRDDQLVLQIESASDGLIVLRLARIRSIPRAGIATYDTMPGKTTTSSAIHNPAKIAAQREPAPDMTVNAVVLSEPPTGSPRNNPEATLAAPCAMKSRDALRRDSSGFGTLWLTPAPCTRMIKATANAPVTTSKEMAENDGIWGVGIPPGISPTSRTT